MLFWIFYEMRMDEKISFWDDIFQITPQMDEKNAIPISSIQKTKSKRSCGQSVASFLCVSKKKFFLILKIVINSYKIRPLMAKFTSSDLFSPSCDPPQCSVVKDIVLKVCFLESILGLIYLLFMTFLWQNHVFIKDGNPTTFFGTSIERYKF